jgi:CxxC motif-containing protein (DUF1111 family)
VARAGEVLFNHRWQPHDPLCPGGDGLGPVYNADSCVACHRRGGVGGSGDRQHNVTTFLVLEPTREEPRRRDGVIHAQAVSRDFLELLRHVHPSLPAAPLSLAIDNRLAHGFPGLVHRGGRHAGPMPAGLVENDMVVEEGPVSFSQRNTPALFGAGLIDSLPDRVIIANQRSQRLRHGMAPAGGEAQPVGRVLRLPGGRVGKFGWKAQVASLADFVQAACANELGLGNPGHEQPTPLGQPQYRPVGLDLTQQQCDQLTAFVASLSRPVERPPADPHERDRAAAGKALFTKTGCAECHTPNLGSVEGLYSDLLLHRMGQTLEGRGSSYGGAQQQPSRTPSEEEAQPDEWRTPPLWGVADSAPYLHDGRAATPEEAIRLHDGQAAAAAGRFNRLSPHDQACLVEFLRTLRAP